MVKRVMHDSTPGAQEYCMQGLITNAQAIALFFQI